MADAECFWSIADSGLSISEHPAVFSVLRLRRDDHDGAQALAADFGAAWPVAPNDCTDAAPRVAWLAPGEWGILAPAVEVRARITQACAGRLHHLADLSAGRRLWRIGGAQSRALLARGCSLDTHPGAMPAGRCAQTLLAQVAVLLVAGTTGDSFEIVADASFAGHLRLWFDQAAQDLLA